MAINSDVDGILRELHSQGLTALASDVAGLQPQKNESTPDILQYQQRYARLPGSPLTNTFVDKLYTHAPLPQQQGQAAVQVTFDLVQAPSAFTLPIMQKRAWDPPFQVRMSWQSSLPLQFTATVAVFMVDEAGIRSMLSWQLPSPQEAAKQLLEHQQERVVLLGPGRLQMAEGELAGSSDGAAWTHCAEAFFTFNKLAFGQPSQMRPRWLVFAGSLVGGGWVYSHYRLPTVVMSRLAEQFEKAKRVLWGGIEPACDSSVMKLDYKQLRKYIKRELVGVGISREPSEEDYRYLANRAGFVVAGEGVRGGSASLEELAAFKAWFAGHLIMLKHIRGHWERSDPQVVCGFGMTREQAEALLAPHPRGTFLLRFGSQGGMLVLSVRSADSPCPAVTHYSLACAALQSNGLEAVLERNGTAQQLLDSTTGLLHPRTTVLDRSYLQAVDVAEAKKRYRRPTEGSGGGSDEGESNPSADMAACCPSGLSLPSMDAPGSGIPSAMQWGPLDRVDSLRSLNSQHVSSSLQQPALQRSQRTQHVGHSALPPRPPLQQQAASYSSQCPAAQLGTAVLTASGTYQPYGLAAVTPATTGTMPGDAWGFAASTGGSMDGLAGRLQLQQTHGRWAQHAPQGVDHMWSSPGLQPLPKTSSQAAFHAAEPQVWARQPMIQPCQQVQAGGGDVEVVEVALVRVGGTLPQRPLHLLSKSSGAMAHFAALPAADHTGDPSGLLDALSMGSLSTSPTHSTTGSGGSLASAAATERQSLGLPSRPQAQLQGHHTGSTVGSLPMQATPAMSVLQSVAASAVAGPQSRPLGAQPPAVPTASFAAALPCQQTHGLAGMPGEPLTAMESSGAEASSGILLSDLQDVFVQQQRGVAPAGCLTPLPAAPVREANPLPGGEPVRAGILQGLFTDLLY